MYLYLKCFKFFVKYYYSHEFFVQAPLYIFILKSFNVKSKIYFFLNLHLVLNLNVIIIIKVFLFIFQIHIFLLNAIQAH